MFYFASYAGTSVYLLYNSQISSIKQIKKPCISTLTHDPNINDHMQLLK